MQISWQKKRWLKDFNSEFSKTHFWGVKPKVRLSVWRTYFRFKKYEIASRQILAHLVEVVIP